MCPAARVPTYTRTMSVTIIANASCKSFEAEDVQETTKKELTNTLPDDSIKSMAAIKGAAANASASWTRVETLTTAAPPYSSINPRSTAKGICDVDFTYTITKPGQSGTGYLKPL